MEAGDGAGVGSLDHFHQGVALVDPAVAIVTLAAIDGQTQRIAHDSSDGAGLCFGVTGTAVDI